MQVSRVIPYWQANFPLGIKRKSGATFVVPDFLRRERDSCFGKRLRRLRTPTRVFSSPLMQKRKPDSFLFLAEREGFEPPVPFSTSVFKTGAIDHSATSPGFLLCQMRWSLILTLQRYSVFFNRASVLAKKCMKKMIFSVFVCFDL